MIILIDTLAKIIFRFSDSMFKILSFEKLFHQCLAAKMALLTKYSAYNDFENNGIYAILQNNSQPASLIF